MVLVLLMIYLFSNSYRNCNPFTLLPSPSTKVLNFCLDFLLVPSLNAFYPISEFWLNFFKVAISEQTAERFAAKAFIFTKIYCQRAVFCKVQLSAAISTHPFPAITYLFLPSFYTGGFGGNTWLFCWASGHLPSEKLILGKNKVLV